ncbi:hypothetical protein OROMI_027997 [Orobanche minor]
MSEIRVLGSDLNLSPSDSDFPYIVNLGSEIRASEVDSVIVGANPLSIPIPNPDYKSIRSNQSILSWLPSTVERVATSFHTVPDYSWEQSESDFFVLCPQQSVGDDVGKNPPFTDKGFWLDDSNRHWIEMLCILCPWARALIYRPLYPNLIAYVITKCLSCEDLGVNA